MKKVLFVIGALASLIFLLLCSACNQNPEETVDSGAGETPQEDTTAGGGGSEIGTEDETMTGKYADLSALHSPVIEPNPSDWVTAVSPGTNATSAYTIRFNEAEEGYSFASLEFSGRHDAYCCENCKYVEKDGEQVFYMHTDESAHIGLAVDLKKPIDAALVSAVTITVMTDQEITKASDVRLFPRYETNTSVPLNHKGYSDLSGASGEWKTIDFCFSATHIDALTDDDGFIRGFKLMLRDNDGTGVYIKDITFHRSIEDFCKVESIEENAYDKGGALRIIADRIARNLYMANIGADVEVKAQRYVSNTSAKDGKIVYDVLVKTPDGKEHSYSGITATISKVHLTWLNMDGEAYSFTRDSKDQWKNTFDDGGIIVLEDNLIRVPEGLASVEYAVIGKEVAVSSEDIVWSTPQILEMSEDGFTKLYANAALDYVLEAGQEYRFVIRGITRNENYALHLDILFTYQPLAEEPLQALNAAKKIVLNSGISFTSEQENKEEFVRSEIVRLIKNDQIRVDIRMLADGLISSTYSVKLTYDADVVSSRYPAYVLDGESRNDFFAYAGNVYTVPQMRITYVEHSSDIVLTQPLDGQTDIRIASDATVRFWNTATDILVSNQYEYGPGEACDPRPVHLAWTDTAGEGTIYTVRVSESPNMTDPWVFTTTETSYDVYNLKTGTEYYWNVERDGAASATITFATEEGYTRYILSDNVSNFRDIGGYMTVDGKRVKQGLAFRLSNFDKVSPADRQFITQNLGVRTELDLRGATFVSPLGNGVKVYPISIMWYDGIFTDGQGEPIRQAITLFADESNYPIGYHCLIGRDRTGTVTILLLGLLGVDEDTIIKEFMLTKNSVSGSEDGTSAVMLHNGYQNFMNKLDAFGGENDSLQKKIENYLLSIGVTQEEINSICEILLEKP